MSILGFQILLSLGALAAGAAETAAVREPFPVGEKLKYRVKFIIFPAGYSTMEVIAKEEENGLKVARLKMVTRSSGLIGALVSVDDVATSTVDLATGGVIRSRIDKKEGGRDTIEEFTLSSLTTDPTRKAIRSYTRNHKGREKRQESEYTGPVQDVLSFFYRLRALEFRLGRYTDVTVFQGHKAYVLRLAADGLEVHRVRGVGTFWAYCIHPSSAVPGLFSPDGDATLWLEQTTHTLLRMDVRTPKGTASMYLVDAEKSPLSSAPAPGR